MEPKTTTPDNSPTEETVQNGKATDYAQERVIDWYAAGKMVYWDMDKRGVVRRPSVTELAQELGISRQTIYNWAKTLPDFEARKQRAHEGIVTQNSIAVWNMVYLKACRGDLRAAEMYLTTFQPDFAPVRWKTKPQPQTAGLTELLQKARQRQAEAAAANSAS